MNSFLYLIIELLNAVICLFFFEAFPFFSALLQSLELCFLQFVRDFSCFFWVLKQISLVFSFFLLLKNIHVSMIGSCRKRAPTEPPSGGVPGDHPTAALRSLRGFGKGSHQSGGPGWGLVGLG